MNFVSIYRGSVYAICNMNLYIYRKTYYILRSPIFRFQHFYKLIRSE